ncbi:MAG: ATP-binding protein [Parahaliea sp.]
MLRNNLTIKLFIAFWMITTGILGSWLLAARYFDSIPGDLIEIEQPGPPPRFILRLIYQLQTVSDKELRELIREQRRRHNINIYLLNDKGRDLLGRKVPEFAQKVAAQLSPEQPRVFLKQERQPPVTAYAIYRQQQGHLRAVLTPDTRHQHSLMRALGDRLWLRILLAVLISGLLCYMLSRLMTRRLDHLRDTVRELAGGNLDARTPVRASGGDETDELARAFNTMAEQLQRRIIAQRRLLSDVSHELRSPLARMKLSLALAQQRPGQCDTQLQRLERETSRLDELIGQLLSSQANHQQMDEHIDLAILLREICSDADFEARAHDKQVGLQCKTDQALVTTRGDLLQKTFENILRNAVHYTPAGTRVEVCLGKGESHYEVQVCDAGPGVPEDDLESIFDAFYRVDTARARETGGYGLGLSIARRAVEQHGGTIRARNNRETGLCMTVSLPISDDM